MCEQFQCSKTFSDLAKIYNAQPIGQLESNGDRSPGDFTPGLLQNSSGQRELHPMRFAIARPNPEAAAYRVHKNCTAAIEEPTKWPWLDAIQASRCVLPISALHIQCYWGDPEGTEAYFYSEEEKILHVAGVYRTFLSSATNQLCYSMSFLSRPASDYIMDHGSHRQPIFLQPTGIDTWIAQTHYSCEQAIQTLRKYSHDPNLTRRHVCDMPTGWQNRQKGQIRKRGQQLAAQDRCQYACGF